MLRNTYSAFARQLGFMAGLIVVAASLTACGGGDGDDDNGQGQPVSNAVTAAISPAGPVAVLVGGSQTVDITFAATEGTASGLNVTSGLTPLPAGWSVANSTLPCETVDTGSACLISLTYAPTAETQSSTLPLVYSYTDRAGQQRTGQANVTYSAVPSNTPVANLTSNRPVTAPVGGMETVGVTFATLGGEARDLRVTNDPSTLPPGWSFDPNFVCGTVTNSKDSCQLNLTYAPTTVVINNNFTLNYTYTDVTNVVKAGKIIINYSAGEPGTVVATAFPANVVNVAVGSTGSAGLVFNSIDGAASNLRVTTDLANLPAGWRAAETSFACETVTAMGQDCQLNLTYAPSAETAQAALPIAYAYTDANGVERTGTANVAYSAGSGDGQPVATAFAVQRTPDGAASIQSCSVTSQGDISGCTALDVAGLNNPSGIALSGNYAYIANFPVDNSPGTLLKCSVDPSNITLSGCTDAGAPPISGMVDVAFAGNRAYIVSLTGNSVTRCAVGGDGSLSDCADAGATGLSSPTAMAFAGANAYIVSNSAFVTRCTVEPLLGNLSACTAMTVPGMADLTSIVPYGIALSNGTAYITSQGNDNVLRCTIDEAGGFSACTANDLAGVNVGSLSEISFLDNRAYIINATGESSFGVIRCDVGQDPALNACTALPEAPFSSLAFL